MRLIILVFLTPLGAINNGVGRTPPMGFLSWGHFRCQTDCDRFPQSCINDQLFRRTAQAMKDRGLLSAGYTYITIDDCWQGSPQDSEIRADPQRFPEGILPLSREIHGMGFKFGMYTDIGTRTCMGYPGIDQHFREVAELLQTWEVDMIKVDGCYAESKEYVSGYRKFSQELARLNRPVLYLCSMPAYLEGHCETEGCLEFLKNTCNTWRNYGDIDESYESLLSIIQFWRRSSGDYFVEIAGPGGFNDPDMLLIGTQKLSVAESQLQFGLWAIFSAPLFISCPVDSLSEADLQILLNAQVLSVNQDALGVQGFCYRHCQSDIEAHVWVKRLDGFGLALAFTNEEGREPLPGFEFTLSAQEFQDLAGGWPEGELIWHDLFVDEEVAASSDRLRIQVPPLEVHGIQLFTVRGRPKVWHLKDFF